MGVGQGRCERVPANYERGWVGWVDGTTFIPIEIRGWRARASKPTRHWHQRSYAQKQLNVARARRRRNLIKGLANVRMRQTLGGWLSTVHY